MKQDRWFSAIMAIAMLCIGLVSLFNPIGYFKHIADAVALFTFVIFVSEPWIVETASNKLGFIAVKKNNKVILIRAYAYTAFLSLCFGNYILV